MAVASVGGDLARLQTGGWRQHGVVQKVVVATKVFGDGKGNVEESRIRELCTDTPPMTDALTA